VLKWRSCSLINRFPVISYGVKVTLASTLGTGRAMSCTEFLNFKAIIKAKSGHPP
jgi:hypothetical protein